MHRYFLLAAIAKYCMLPACNYELTHVRILASRTTRSQTHYKSGVLMSDLMSWGLLSGVVQLPVG